MVIATPTSSHASTPVADGGTYYVSRSGSDSNPGTESAPFKTIQKAVESAHAGETILVRAGTYRENVAISRSGRVGSDIVLTNYPGEVVQIDGGSEMALYSRGPVGYWTIEGFQFRSTNQHTLRFGWFEEAITHHITLRNNYINGTVFTVGNYQLFEGNEFVGADYSADSGYGGINDSHGGFGDDATHHNIYRRNYIHDFTNPHARGIWTQGRTHDQIIEYNRIENIWTDGLGQCIDADAARDTLVQWRQTVRNNTLKDCSYVGIQLENVFDSLVENNLVSAEKGGEAGIIVISYVGCGVGGENNQYGDINGDGSCKGEPTHNIIRQNILVHRSAWGWGYGGVLNWGAGGLQILNNTIYAARSGGNAAINFQAEADQSGQAVVQNNILYNGNSPAICALDFASFAQDGYNLLYRTDGESVYGNGPNCADIYSLADYQATTGRGQNSIQADPLFVNLTGYDFHLMNTSPGIDHGTSLDLATDFDGLPRPQGAGYDMGAYEYGSGSAP